MRGRILTVLTVALLAAAVPAEAETSWTPVTPAPPTDLSSAGLFDVSAVSPSDVWAVGNGWTDSQQPLIDHWTGAGWQSVTPPSRPDLQYSITGVDAVSARDVWVVGNGEALPAPGYTALAVVAHYDGTAWSLAPAPTPAGYAALSDVDMLSARDGWAVGWQTPALAQPLRPLVMRWRGGAWSTISVPRVDGGNAQLSHVSARAANDVWAVGSVGDTPLVMHYDGVRWTRMAVPTGSGGADAFETLRSVVAVSAGEAWAVGDSCVLVDDGTACTPLVLRLCGGSWRVVPTAGDGTNLRDVVVRSSTDVWVVGYDLPPGGVEANHVEHWDGQRFTTVPTTGGGGVSTRGQLASALEAATRLPGTNELWAVGWQATGPQAIRHG